MCSPTRSAGFCKEPPATHCTTATLPQTPLTAPSPFPGPPLFVCIGSLMFCLSDQGPLCVQPARFPSAWSGPTNRLISGLRSPGRHVGRRPDATTAGSNGPDCTGQAPLPKDRPPCAEEPRSRSLKQGSGLRLSFLRAARHCIHCTWAQRERGRERRPPYQQTQSVYMCVCVYIRNDAPQSQNMLSHTHTQR